VTPGTLNVQTGGSTGFSLSSTFTTGETVYGGTPFNLSYTPKWSGSMYSSTPAGSGSFSSQFVYNIGPFSGSTTILNVPLSIPGHVTGPLNSSLNSPVALPVFASQNLFGPGVSATGTLSAQGCFIVCVTVASASLSFNVGTEIQQSVLATPIVQYGDLVWESTSATYSPADHPTFVSGSFGSIANMIGGPPSGVAVGHGFYFNVLPVVELTMPILDSADVAIPASITASWDIFGAGGSHSWPLGNLYELNANGAVSFNPIFYGGEFYSLPLIYDGSAICTFACDEPMFTVGGSGGNPVNTPSGGVPGDTGPCGGSLVDCSVNVPTTGTNEGYGDTPIGPLFPGDPSSNPICGPIGTAYANYCIDTPPTSTLTQSVPEPDTFALCCIGSLGILLLRRRRARGRIAHE
jgi:hypothetical protein